MCLRLECFRLPELDVRRVAPLRQFDANGILLAVGLIIFAKPVTQSRGLHANDWVDVGIKRLWAIENFPGDVIALQPLAASGQRFIHDVL